MGERSDGNRDDDITHYLLPFGAYAHSDGRTVEAVERGSRKGQSRQSRQSRLYGDHACRQYACRGSAAYSTYVRLLGR